MTNPLELPDPNSWSLEQLGEHGVSSFCGCHFGVVLHNSRRVAHSFAGSPKRFQDNGFLWLHNYIFQRMGQEGEKALTRRASFLERT